MDDVITGKKFQTSTMARSPSKTKKNGEPKRKPGPKPHGNYLDAPLDRTKLHVSLSLAQKVEVLDKMAESKWSLSQTARYFSTKHKIKLTPTHIHRFKKGEAAMREKMGANPLAGQFKRVKEVLHKNLEDVLAAWVATRQGNGETVTGPLIKAKAERFAEVLRVEGMTFSEGWLTGFKKRHGLSRRKRHGEAGSVDTRDAEEERKRLQPILKKYNPEDIWNFDETAFNWRQLLNWTLASQEVSGTKLDKSRLSVLVGTNMTGTEKFQLLFIGKSKQPRCFKKKTPKAAGFNYYFNKKAWMTSAVFTNFMAAFEKKMVRQERHCLVLLDNFSGHQWDEDDVQHTDIEFFHPNLTPYVQPMDAGIIRTLKAKYKKAILERSLDLEESGEQDIFKIDQLQAMRILEKAWDAVSEQTIANCWKHTGIMQSDDE